MKETSLVTAKPSYPDDRAYEPFTSIPDTGDPAADARLAEEYLDCKRIVVTLGGSWVTRKWIAVHQNWGVKFRFYCVGRGSGKE